MQHQVLFDLITLLLKNKYLAPIIRCIVSPKFEVADSAIKVALNLVKQTKNL